MKKKAKVPKKNRIRGTRIWGRRTTGKRQNLVKRSDYHVADSVQDVDRDVKAVWYLDTKHGG